MRPVDSIQYAKSIILLFIISFFSTNLWAQTAPPIQWKRSLGGTQTDQPFAVTNTFDGGYVVVGRSSSNDNDVVGNHYKHPYSKDDGWAVRIDSNGSVVWKKCFGGDRYDSFDDIVPTLDSCFVIIGESSSYKNGDVTGIYPDTCSNCENPSIWMVKINGAGNVIWERSIGGSSYEYARSLVNTVDGGFAFVGTTESINGDLWGKQYAGKVWFAKTNNKGQLWWQKAYGGSLGESPIELKNTSDKGFIITGTSKSNDGGVNKRQGGLDVWVLKIDSLGVIQWNKTYGGSKDDYHGGSIIEDIQGGYTLLAHPASTDGDISSNKGRSDIWVVRLDDTGKIIWEKSFGGSQSDGFSKILQTPDSGYVIAGFTASYDLDITVNNGPYDWWILKIDKDGNKKWQKSIGSTGDERPVDMTLARDGYFIIGTATANSGDVLSTGYKGGVDYFWVKLKENFKPTGIEENILNTAIKVYPSPTSGVVHIDLPIGYEKAEVKVYDMMGKVLQVKTTEKGAKRTVDLSRIASGTYTIQVIHGGQEQSYKVINQQ